MSKFAYGERVRFEKSFGFFRHDDSWVPLASERAAGTVLGTFEGRTPRLVLVRLDDPALPQYQKVEVPEDYLTAE